MSSSMANQNQFELNLKIVPLNPRHPEEDPVYFWFWITLSGLNLALNFVTLVLACLFWNECELPFSTYALSSGLWGTFLSLFKLVQSISARFCNYPKETMTHICCHPIRLSVGLVLEVLVCVCGIILLATCYPDWTLNGRCSSYLVHWIIFMLFLGTVGTVVIICSIGCFIGVHLICLVFKWRGKYQLVTGTNTSA